MFLRFRAHQPIRIGTLSRLSYRGFASDTCSSSPLVSSYIVIGNGPIGASVAKNLIASLASAANPRTGGKRRDILVTIIDGSSTGIGSSHSDRARLIRTFDAEGDLDWTRWNQRSLEAFPEIERVWNNEYNTRNSDVTSHENTTRKRKSFFKKCGALLIGDEEFVARSKKAAEESLSSSSSSFSLLSPTEYQKVWPYLKPKSGCDVALFDPSGGIIDPLRSSKLKTIMQCRFVRFQNRHLARPTIGTTVEFVSKLFRMQSQTLILRVQQ